MMRNSEFLSASHDLGSLAEGLRMPALGARVDQGYSQSARFANTGAAGHPSTTTTSKSLPHARIQENGSRNHSYCIAFEDRLKVELVRARMPHQHILAYRRL